MVSLILDAGLTWVGTYLEASFSGVTVILQILNSAIAFGIAALLFAMIFKIASRSCCGSTTPRLSCSSGRSSPKRTPRIAAVGQRSLRGEEHQTRGSQLHRGAVPSSRLVRPRRTAAVARGSADLASPIDPRQGLSFSTASVRNYDQVRFAP